MLFSTKKNKLSSHDETWRKLKCVLLSEGSQCEKATHSVTLITSHSGKGTSMGTVKRPAVARGRGAGRDEQPEHREVLGQ